MPALSLMLLLVGCAEQSGPSLQAEARRPDPTQAARRSSPMPVVAGNPTTSLAALYYQEGTPEEQIYPFSSEITIGRDRDNDIQIKNDRGAAPQAARIFRADGGWSIEDLADGRGALVNGQRIRMLCLAGGEEIVVGETRFRFRLVAGAEGSEMATDAPAHPLHDQLAAAVAQIAAQYGDTPLPPPVARLRELVEERAYEQLRTELTPLWTDLLGFHMKQGMRIHHEVTLAFNAVQALALQL